MRGDQLARQWRIIRAIEASHSGLTVSELAQLEGRGVRTIYRDLEALMQAGFPLYTERFERANRWAFIDTYKFKIPPPFTLTELMSLYIYRDLVRVFKGTAFYDSLESVFKKIRSTLPPKTLAFLDRIQSAYHVGIKPFKEYGHFRETINQINKAVLDKLRIEIVYHPLRRKEDTLRKVDPYKVWFYDGTIYLIGHCHLRGEVRMFVLDRIKMINVTDEQFDLPPGFDLSEFLRHSFKVMHDEIYKVIVRISPEWARWAGEKIWHESQKAKKMDDGSLELTFQVAGLDEIKQWVMSLGPEAMVIVPERLKEMVMDDLSRTLQQYEVGEKFQIIPPTIGRRRGSFE